MRESIAICRDFATEMKINVWFRQGGYLFLARSAERARALEESVALQNRCGLPTRMLDAARCGRSCPSWRPRGCARELQPGRRGGVSVALRVGLRARRDGPRRDHQALHRGGGLRDAQRPHHRREAAPDELSPLDPSDEVLPAGDAFTEECDEVVICAGAWSPGRGAARGRAAQQAAPSRDLRDRAAEAVARAAGGGPHRRAVFLAVDARRDRRGRGRRPGARRGSTSELERASGDLREGAGAGGAGAGGGEGAAPVGRLLRPHARRRTHRRPGGRAVEPHAGVRLHGPRVHDGAGDGALLAEHVATGETSELFARWSLDRFARGDLVHENMIIG
jgi:hypothetical protein